MGPEVRKGDSPAVEEFRGEKSRKVLKSAVEATAYMKEYFRRVKERMAQGEPVVWPYRVPIELFLSMDILFIDSVYYSALCSAKQMSRYYLDRLNQEGYFRDLCRYCTVPLGYAFDKKPETAPWGGLPKFTAMVATHRDDPAQKICEIYAREFDIPLYMIDRGYMGRFPGVEHWWEELREADTAVEAHRVDQVLSELEGLIRFLETITGKAYSESGFRHSVERMSQQMENYWKATDLAGETVPCPISWTDVLSNLPASMYFSGTEFALDHSQKYLAEVKERVDRKEGVCQDEKVRLMFWGHPVWFSLGFYNSWEDKYGAVFLPMYYMPIEGFDIRRNLSNPLRAYASFCNTWWQMLERVPTTRKQYLMHIARKYKASGVVFMVVESCKLLYTGVLYAREAFERAGIPTIEINADMVDARDWDDAKMKALVTSFVETLLG